MIIEVADKYFSMQNYKDCMELLLLIILKINKVKEKMVEYFGVLGSMNILLTIEKTLTNNFS